MEQSTLICIQYRCEITGRHYNTPDGRYCTKCWGKVPKARKHELAQKLIRKWSTPRLFDELCK